VKCPTCGARNGVGVRRCRICTAVLDADAPEDRRGFAKPRHEFGGEAPEDVTTQASSPTFDAPVPPEPAATGEPEPASDEGASADVFDPDDLFRQMDR
jgi:hypothetical protein